MADFLKAHKIVMINEGGYSNNPNDRGQETFCGISRKNFPDWDGWDIVDKYKLTNAATFPAILETDPSLKEMIVTFYRAYFWDGLRLGEIESQEIATELYDTAVNAGRFIAGCFLQKALNVLNRNQKDYKDLPTTGMIGPLTLAALQSQKNTKNVLKILNCLQGARYVEICLANPTQEQFISSWLSRVAI